MSWNPVIVKGEPEPPRALEGRSVVCAPGERIRLADLPEAIRVFIAGRGGEDELISVEWHVSPTDFEIHVKVEDAQSKRDVRPIPKGGK